MTNRRAAILGTLFAVLEARHVEASAHHDEPLFEFSLDPQKVQYTDVFMSMTYGERTVKMTVKEVMDALDPYGTVQAHSSDDKPPFTKQPQIEPFFVSPLPKVVEVPSVVTPAE